MKHDVRKPIALLVIRYIGACISMHSAKETRLDIG